MTPEVLYLPGFLGRAEADRLLAVLLALPDFRQERLRMFGRPVDAPRLTAWYADEGCRYAYSGTVHEAIPWPDDVAALRERVEAEVGVAFNGVLANHYRDGRDGVGWHSDDEKELGPQPVIASLSFGAERRFLIRHRTRQDLTHEYVPAHGSLLVMRGDSQRHWKHSLPKTKRCHEARVNLSFRRVRASPRESEPRSPRRSRSLAHAR